MVVYELETLARSRFFFFGPSSYDLCPAVLCTAEQPKGDSLLLLKRSLTRCWSLPSLPTDTVISITIIGQLTDNRKRHFTVYRLPSSFCHRFTLWQIEHGFNLTLSAVWIWTPTSHQGRRWEHSWVPLVLQSVCPYSTQNSWRSMWHCELRFWYRYWSRQQRRLCAQPW